jgi:hypothetical protein
MFMAESAKAATIKRAMEDGYTGGYGNLLHLTAVISLGPEAFYSTHGEELSEWRGFFRGLKAALLCLAMYERQICPDEAALVVDRHLDAAMDSVEHRDGASSGGMR